MMPYRFFLGGHDLEMIEIKQLLIEAGFGEEIVDKGLAWGAKVSDYTGEINEALAAGKTPVLIELALDEPIDAAMDRVVVVDHHGAQAVDGAPASLRQVYDLIAPETSAASGAPVHWTRWRALVAINDVAHIKGLEAFGVKPDEIRQVRDADRAAQGVDLETEAESRRAAAAATEEDGLLLVETTANTSSAIMDFLHPVYRSTALQNSAENAPENAPDNTLVIMPDKVSFFGSGTAILALKDLPGCWYGGDPPARGFWGVARGEPDPLPQIRDLLRAALAD